MSDSATTKRKGYSRRADVPPELLAALNAGTEPTVTLAEYLSIDMAVLLAAALKDVGLTGDAAKQLVDQARAMAGDGVTVRMKTIGRILHEAAADHPKRDALLSRLATHPADMVRGWAAYRLMADDSLDLPQRLALARHFAADLHMGVREAAWDCIRPFLCNDLNKGIELLLPWVRDPDANVRRCAVEATRPRGVWCAHIESLKRDPSPALPLLEVVRSDASRYVQKSVANWLNDASKTRPDWVTSVCKRWKKESKTAETLWIIHHANRTIRKG